MTNNVTQFRATRADNRIELLFRCTTGLVAITLPLSEARGLIAALREEISADEKNERIAGGRSEKARKRRVINPGKRDRAGPASQRNYRR